MVNMIRAYNLPQRLSFVAVPVWLDCPSYCWNPRWHLQRFVPSPSSHSAFEGHLQLSLLRHSKPKPANQSINIIKVMKFALMTEQTNLTYWSRWAQVKMSHTRIKKFNISGSKYVNLRFVSSFSQLKFSTTESDKLLRLATRAREEFWRKSNARYN